MTINITSLRSPEYTTDRGNWFTWRAAVTADEAYVRATLQKLPSESVPDFIKRMAITPIPAYIKATLREILTGIYAHMDATVRIGGPTSFQAVIGSSKHGVDGAGMSMNYFMIMQVLRELLITKRVGIFIDRKPLPVDATLQDALEHPPYLYIYTAEQILAWSISSENLVPDEILLRQEVPVYHPGTQITVRTQEQYLYGHKIPGGIQFDIYDSNGVQTSTYMQDMPELPFVLLEISDSLVQDVVGHQAALLNLGSSNISFAIAANLAVYTEQTDMAWLVAQLKQADTDSTEEEEDADIAGRIKVGLNRGRRYPQNTDRPEFITPDNENLTRAATYYKDLQDDIRRIMLLTIQNVSARGLLTATSLMQNQASVNNGLAALAALLEKGETRVANIWAAYENDPQEYSVEYPTDFQSITGVNKAEAIKALTELRDAVPSRTFREQVTQELARLILGPRIPVDVIQKITQQIKEAPLLIGDPKVVIQLVEGGVCPREYAATVLSLPKDAAEKANMEHAERLQRISEAQANTTPSAARGNSDGVDDATDEKRGSQAADFNPAGGKQVRK